MRSPGWTPERDQARWRPGWSWHRIRQSWSGGPRIHRPRRRRGSWPARAPFRQGLPVSRMSDMSLPGRFAFCCRECGVIRGKDNIGKTSGRIPCTLPPSGHGVWARFRDRYPRGAVLFVLRLDRVARRGPVGIAPVAQLIKIAAHRQRLAAVHRDGLAVDPVAAAGNQEHREVLQLLHLADAAHRIERLGARAGLVAGLDALAHALGRDFAGRDGVEADAVMAPFGGQRHGHGVDGGFAHGRGHHIGAAVAHPGHRDRHHVAGMLGRRSSAGRPRG